MDNKRIPFDPDWDKVLNKLEADQAAGLELNVEEEQLLKSLQGIRADAAAALKSYNTFGTDRKWAEFRQQLSPEQAVDDKPEQVLKDKNHQPIRLWLKIAAAAAIFIIVGLGLIFQKSGRHNQQAVNIFLNDIPAGKQSATLTLDNGQKIVLSGISKGQLTAESGIVISKSADGQLRYHVNGQHAIAAAGKIHTLSTGNGETYRLQLPDHTEIWLNSASSLKFPASFDGLKSRKVELRGEAYFEVAKDKEHPFIVKTEQQEVQVLGTHFNINSDADQRNTRTTLLEGSVKIINRDQKEQLIRPGEQSLVNDGAGILVSPADLKTNMAWKNGYFRFKAESIEEVMLKISRWYAIDVRYQGPISKEKFSGNISMNKNISEVLNMLSYANAVKFKVEGRRVTVMQ